MRRVFICLLAVTGCCEALSCHTRLDQDIPPLPEKHVENQPDPPVAPDDPPDVALRKRGFGVFGNPVTAIVHDEGSASDWDLAHLEAFPELEQLSLIAMSNITSHGMVHLRHCKKLRILQLEHMRRIDDAALEHVALLPQLRELRLWMTSVGDAGLGKIPHLVELQVLDLGFTKVTDDGVGHLGNCVKLKEVVLVGTRVSDRCMSTVARWKDLEYLAIYETQISDDGVLQLTGMKRLHTLKLPAAIGDRGFQHICGFRNLAVLWANDTAVTDQGLAGLKKLPKLEWLILSDTAIDGSGLRHLVGCQELRKLRLDGTRITDATLLELKPLQRLEVLDLSGTKISDEGLIRLVEHLPNLKEVSIMRRVSEQTRQELKMIRPQLLIH
jgi:hypothetical protein